MKLRLLGVVLGILFIGSQAHAGLLIDPYVGTASSKTTFEFGGTDNDDTSSASAFGSRLGYSFILLSAGLDYRILKGDDMDQNSISAFVGVDLPILLRFWAEYFISSPIDFKDDNTIQEIDFKGGYGLGIGFTGLPFVSLNLEVEYLNYEFNILNVDGELDFVNTIFSVSFPIDL